MGALDRLRLALAEIGAGAWLTVRAGQGVALDIVEHDTLARGRLAAAMTTYVWRPLPTLVALELNKGYGLWGVGLYLTANGVLTLGALFVSRETRDIDLAAMST